MSPGSVPSDVTRWNARPCRSACSRAADVDVVQGFEVVGQELDRRDEDGAMARGGEIWQHVRMSGFIHSPGACPALC